jgi:DNA-binding transcriptional MerR regulator
VEISKVKKIRIGEVADMFGITTQTIRNWLKNDELKGLFSEGANALHGKQHEFTPEDVQLLNSIHSITNTGNYDWRSIAENLKSGWRESHLPMRAAMVDFDSQSALGLAVRLAKAEADLEFERREKQRLEEQVEWWKARANESEDNMRKLIRAEFELELWRTGRLKPEEGQGK